MLDEKELGLAAMCSPRSYTNSHIATEDSQMDKYQSPRNKYRHFYVTRSDILVYKQHSNALALISSAVPQLEHLHLS